MSSFSKSRDEVVTTRDEKISRGRVERDRSRSRSPVRRYRSRSRSPPPSRRRASRSPSTSSTQDSETSRERRHRHKREDRQSRERDSTTGSSSRRREGHATEEERLAKKLNRARREEKKAKKERIDVKKARKKAGLKTIDWGRHGLITESDLYTKDQEFRAWLIEEKVVNPENLSKLKMRDYFRGFMEEFNTATFNSEKYYDISAHEARLRAIANGETITLKTDTYDAQADMDSLRSAHRRSNANQATFLDRARLEELQNIQRERVVMERMLRIGMTPKDSMGVRTEEKMLED